MAVGTSATSDLTRTELITLSLGSIGVAEPSSSDLALGVSYLNMLIRKLDADGKWFWTIDNTESTLTTVASTSNYTTGVAGTNISANILKLESATVLIGSRRIPLIVLDKPSSIRTTLKDDTAGQPTHVYLQRNKLLSDNIMILFPTPNSAYTIKYNFRRPLYDFTSASSNPDMPSAFNLALTKLLASQLAPHFGIPLQERQLLYQDGKVDFEDTIKGMADPPSQEPLRTEYY